MNTKIGKRLLLSGLGLAGVMIALWGGCTLFANRQEARLDKTAEAFFKQVPKTETNASAKQLDQLNKTLDFRFDSPIGRTLTDFMKAQEKKTKGPLDPMPAEIVSYLNQKKVILTAIENHLQSNELPVWQFDAKPMGDFNYAHPSFLYFANLNRLLLLKAIADQQQGRSKEMLAALEASLKLKKAIAQRPDLTGYLIPLILSKQQALILHNLDGIPLNLQKTLLEPNYHEAGINALEFESWIIYKGMKKYIENPSDYEDVPWRPWRVFENGPTTASDKVTDILLAPWAPWRGTYLKMANVNLVQQQVQGYDALKGLNICSGNSDEIEKRVGLTPAPWNLLAQNLGPSRLNAWRKGGARALEMERVQKVLQAKALAAAQGGRWPAALPDLESRVCPGERWVYRVTSEGRMSLAFSREVEESGTGAERKMVPLTYESGAYERGGVR